MQEKLAKLERQSRVRDAMIEISSEISGLRIRQAREDGVSPSGHASISFDMEEIDVDMTGVKLNKHNVSASADSAQWTGYPTPTQVSP